MEPEQPGQVAASQRATTSVADTASAEARLGVALWVRLARAYLRNIRLAEARLRAWDLSVAQFDVLAQVGAQEGIIQQELAQRLLVTQGAVIFHSVVSSASSETSVAVRLVRRWARKRKRVCQVPVSANRHC